MFKTRQRLETNDWKLLGNAGTDATVHFLGTTDNRPVVVRTNNELTAVFVNDGGDFTPSQIVGNNTNLLAYLTNPLVRGFVDGSSSGYVTMNQNVQILTARAGSGALGLRLNRAGGTFGAITGILNGWQFPDFSWNTYTSNVVNTSTSARSARINVTANGDHVAGTNNAVRWALEITRSGWGAATEVLRFIGDNAGVGFNFSGAANTPSCAWEVGKWTAANALPATSGTVQSSGHIGRYTSQTVTTSLDIGTFGSSMWLQGTNRNDHSINQNLLLNPVGGNVGMGVVAAQARLHNGGSTILGSTALPNFTASGSLGTASLTVDAFSGVVCTQTTASVSLTLPAPTIPTAGRMFFVTNSFISTTPVTVGGVAISVGKTQVFRWDSAAWCPIESSAGGGGGHTVAYGTATPITAGTATGQVYHQTSTGTSAGILLNTFTWDGTAWFNESQPINVTNAQLIALRNAGNLRQSQHYLVTDHVQGRLLAGTTILVHACSDNEISENVVVNTTYDNEGWSGIYNADTASILELRDNRNNVVRGLTGVEVGAFDWGNTSYSNVLVDNATLTINIGNGTTKINLTVIEGAVLNLTGFAGSISNFSVEKGASVNLSSANGIWRSTTVRDVNTSLNASGYLGGGDQFANTIYAGAVVNFYSTTSTVVFNNNEIQGGILSYASIVTGSCTVTNNKLHRAVVSTSVGALALSITSSQLVGNTVNHITGTMTVTSSLLESNLLTQNTDSLASTTLTRVNTVGNTSITNSAATLQISDTVMESSSSVVNNAGSLGNSSIAGCRLTSGATITRFSTATVGFTLSASLFSSNSTITQRGSAALSALRLNMLNGASINIISGAGGSLSFTDVDLNKSSVVKNATSTAGTTNIQSGCNLCSNTTISLNGTGNVTLTGGMLSGATITASSGSDFSIINNSSIFQSSIAHNTTAGTFSASALNMYEQSGVTHTTGSIGITNSNIKNSTISQSGDTTASTTLLRADLGGLSSINNINGVISITSSSLNTASQVVSEALTTGSNAGTLAITNSVVSSSSTIRRVGTATTGFTVTSSRISGGSSVNQRGGASLTVSSSYVEGASSVNGLALAGGVLQVQNCNITAGASVSKNAVSTAGSLSLSGTTVSNSATIQTSGIGNISLVSSAFQGSSGFNVSAGDRNYNLTSVFVSNGSSISLSGTGAAVTDTITRLTMDGNSVYNISCSGAANSILNSYISGSSASVVISGTSGGSAFDRLILRNSSIAKANNPSSGVYSWWDISGRSSVAINSHPVGQIIRDVNMSGRSSLVVNKSGTGDIADVNCTALGIVQVNGTTTTVNRLSVESGTVVIAGGSIQECGKKMSSTWTINAGVQLRTYHLTTAAKTTAVNNTDRVDYLGIVSTAPIL